MKLVNGRRLLGAAGVVVLVGVLASAAFAATTGKNPTFNLKALKGTITVDGSSTVGPYTTAGAELFSKAGAKNVRITVGISGTGGGFERFCRGETDLSNASRPMKVSEAKLCATNNVTGWRAFTVANDALSVVVNKSNTWATCLTVAELKKIWEPGSKVNNWKDVRAGFPDAVPEAVRRRHGLRHVRVLHREDQRQGEGLALGLLGERGRQRRSSRALRARRVHWGTSASRTTSRTRTSSRSSRSRTRRRAPASPRRSQPTQNNTYKPLARPLFVYAKGDAFKRKEVQAFIDYIFDNEKADRDASEVRPADQAAAEAGAGELLRSDQAGEQLTALSFESATRGGRPAAPRRLPALFTSSRPVYELEIPVDRDRHYAERECARPSNES